MENVLFDLDGTLVDSSPGIIACFRYAFFRLGLLPPDEGTLRSCIGPPLLGSFRRFFPSDEARALQGVAFYRERYSAEGWKECALYPFVKECLQSLTAAGKSLALATGKPQPFAENILSRCGIDRYFTAVSGSKLDNSFDDKGKIIQKAMELLGAERAQTVMVGDRKHDIAGARENGVRSVGIRVGFAAAGELEEAGATYCVDDFPALLRLLLSI